MEMSLNNGFCEMTQDELHENGGGSTIIQLANSFLANKLRYTILNNTIKNSSLIRIPGQNVSVKA